MEVVLGALPSLLPKLAELLKDEYNLQKEVKGGIIFLQAELESMKAALEHISKIPPDQLPGQDKIWARNVRELSYDIEDSIDTFMVQAKQASEPAKKHGLKKFIDKTLGTLMQPKIRRKIATEIRDIKTRVAEVHERRRRYEVNHISVDSKLVKVDPRALVRYEDVRKLVGIEEARDEVIKLLMEGDELSKEQDKNIVSIVGFGGLGKTTLANVVYEKLRARFGCSAFVSVSQTPDMDKLFRDLFYQLAKHNTPSINIIENLREFLQGKRYFIIIDDIWEISHWDMIRCALPNGSDEYKIITTTRNFSVAEQIGGAYKMNPLSLKNSRILMFRRIFGKEDKDGKCLDEQLAEVSDRILKKCAGVPLAIITIASLLASKGSNKLEWYNVCNSIGAGLEGSNIVENMRKVLSLSYYDMPSPLRTCLLYLSMFPEDYEIHKERLIWMWIGEGFIQPGKQEKSLFEIGESYFNELVNRSMIQPMYDQLWSIWAFKPCRVHDMVLDLIRCLSCEENFVTIWNHMGHSSTSENIRWLSLQKGTADHGNPEDSMCVDHVRSIIVFSSAKHVPTLQKYRVLRVLDLEWCDLSQGYKLKYLGNLLQLRYLGLTGTRIDELPKEIGNLSLLQTLRILGNKIAILPSTFARLTNLMCLYIDEGTRVPKGIGSLTALEVITSLVLCDDSTYIVEELGHLGELKVLRVVSRLTKWNDTLDKHLVESLKKLHKIRTLEILCGSFLRPRRSFFSTAWVNPLLHLNLSCLRIGVKELQQEDLEILGRLPALRDLLLEHKDLKIHGKFIVGACLFPCLVCFIFRGFGGPIVFKKGAMPRLEDLVLEFNVQKTKELNGGFDLGLGNLLSLHEITISFIYGGASKEEVNDAKAVVKHTIEVHPNHPTRHIYIHKDAEESSSTDGYSDED